MTIRTEDGHKPLLGQYPLTPHVSSMFIFFFFNQLSDRLNVLRLLTKTCAT